MRGQCGADKDLCDIKGHTPLDAAAYFGHAEATLLLMDKGAHARRTRPSRIETAEMVASLEARKRDGAAVPVRV